MPAPHAIGPQEDPYKKAARLAMDGDVEGAWDAIVHIILEKAQEDYAPEHNADEDGESVDYEGPAKSAVSYQISLAAEYISDAICDILAREQGMDDQEASGIASDKTEELNLAWQGNVADLVAEIVDEYKDGAAYARDPYAYYGVKRSDFF